MKRNSSKLALINAFVALLTRKPYLDISVSDLVREAGIARASFYRNYDSLDEVLLDAIDRFFSALFNKWIPFLNQADENLVKQRLALFFDHFKDPESPYGKILPENRALIAVRLGQLIITRKEFQSANVEDHYDIYVMVYTIVAACSCWMNKGFKEPSSFVASYVYDKLHR